VTDGNSLRMSANSLPAEQALRPSAGVLSCQTGTLSYVLASNEEVVAAEEVSTQHQVVDISENKGPCELTEAQV